jgi:GNAT superfamily N-acetyltransferase
VARVGAAQEGCKIVAGGRKTTGLLLSHTQRGCYYPSLMDETNVIEISLPKGGTLKLRPVTASDNEFLLSIYASTRADELAQVEWQEGQRLAFLTWQFDLQRREYDTRFPGAEYDLILIDGQPAGRIWVGSDTEQLRLLDIALLPEYQNRGAGTVLMRRLMDQAAQAHKPLRHMVFVLNNDAHRFYERLGFEIIDDLGGYKHMEWKQGSTTGDTEKNDKR